MTREDLLKSVAELGYNVGFGAKKHFATYDILDKVPGVIAFVSIAYGVLALVIESLTNKLIGASVVVLGLVQLYVYLFGTKKEAYNDAGVELTKLFNELKYLYLDIKQAGLQGIGDLQPFHLRLEAIEARYYPICISRQILFSDWYAHFKFFWQHQIDWVNEQKNFRFWRDKMPLSLILWLVILVGGGATTAYSLLR